MSTLVPVTFITSGGRAGCTRFDEVLSDGGAAANIMITTKFADLATRGPPVCGSISGFVGGGAQVPVCSYVYTLVIDDSIAGEVALPPHRMDYMPTAKCAVLREKHYTYRHKIHVEQRVDAQGQTTWQLPNGGPKLTLINDQRMLTWFKLVDASRPIVMTLPDPDVVPSTLQLTGMRSLRLRGTVMAAIPEPGGHRGAAPGLPGLRNKDVITKGLLGLQLLLHTHILLGHAPLRVVLSYLRKFAPHAYVEISKQHESDYSDNPCVQCNQFKARFMKTLSSIPPNVVGPAHSWSVDAFGPTRVASIHHGYWYMIGACCVDTGYTTVEGCKRLDTDEHIVAVNKTRVLAKPYHGNAECVITDSLSMVKEAWKWKKWAVEERLTLANTPAGAHWLLLVEHVWRLWPTALALMASANISTRNWFSAFRHALHLSMVSESKVQARDGRDVHGGEPATSAYRRFFGFDFPMHLLETYGCPVWYVLAPEFVGHKFAEHARPGRYVGVSPTCGWDCAWILTDAGRHVDVLLGQCRFSRAWATEPSVQRTDAELRQLLDPARVLRPNDSGDVGDETVDKAGSDDARSSSQVLEEQSVDQSVDLDESDPNPVQTGQTIYIYYEPEARYCTVKVVDCWRLKSGRWRHQLEWVGHHLKLFTLALRSTSQPEGVLWKDSEELAMPPLAANYDSDDDQVLSREELLAMARQGSEDGQHATPAKHVPRRSPRFTVPLLNDPVSLLCESVRCEPAAASVCVVDMSQFSTVCSEEPGDMGNMEVEVQAQALRKADFLINLTTGCVNADSRPSLAHANLDLGDFAFGESIEELVAAVHDTAPNCTVLAARIQQSGVFTKEFHSLVFDTGPDGHVMVVDLDAADARADEFEDVLLFDASEDTSRVEPAYILAVGAGTFVRVTKEGRIQDLHEPVTYSQYLASPIRSAWRTAMVTEYENVVSDNSAVREVRRCDVPAGKKIYQIVWVWKVKRHADNTFDKLKARACLCGKRMQQGVDYWESYANGARWMSIRLMLSLCAVYDLPEDFHWDVSGAFLVPEVDSEMYTYMPPGFQKYDLDGEPFVWHVLKGLYGAPSSMRLFKQMLKKALLELGFIPFDSDDNFFMYKGPLGIILMCTHVDEGFGAGSSAEVVQYMMDGLKKASLKMSAVARWSTVKGFGVVRDRITRSVKVTCTRHIEDAARRFLSTDVKITPKTPYLREMAKIRPLASPKRDDDPPVLEGGEATDAASLNGASIYIVAVRPDVATPIALVSRRMSKPTTQSYKCNKHILMYLLGTKDRGMVFGGGGRSTFTPSPHAGAPLSGSYKEFSLHGAGDSNLEDPNVEPYSMTGWVILFGGGPIAHGSQRQHSVAKDICAGETYAQSTLAAHMVLAREMVDEASYVFPELRAVVDVPSPLYCDNSAVVLVAKDAGSAKNVPYIMRRIRFLQELQFRGLILILPIGGKQNPADVLTKLLESYEDFKRFTFYIMNDE